jgi:hypothetical protein
MNSRVTSTVDGSPAAGVRTVASTNPARLEEARMGTVELTPDTTFRL